MSLDAVRVKSEQLLASVMAAEFPGTKISYENVKFSQPKGVPWVDIKIATGENKPANLGANPHYHDYGVINITVLVPEEKGTKPGLDRADAIKKAFRNKKFSLGVNGYLTYYCVTVRNRGILNGFHAYGVMVEYRLGKTEMAQS